MTGGDDPEPGSWVDRMLDVEIGAVAHGGHCVARHEGRVVFVRHALPGERVHAVVTEDGGGAFCRADAVTVLDAAPGRVEPACAWAGPGGCGGCDFQHADHDTQRDLKATVVAEQLARIAGIGRTVTCEALPGGPLHWRTRLRMAVTDDGRPGLRAHRSHEVLPVGDCPIAAPGALAPVLDRDWTPTAEVEVVRDATGAVHVAELFEGARVEPDPAADAGGGPLGDGTAHEHAAGRDWSLPAAAFWQVHPAAADAVVAAVLDGVGDLGAGERVWDLYGGAGLIAAALAERVGADGLVVIVESDPGATAAAADNLTDLPACRVVRGRVEKVIDSLARSDGVPDVIVADPPRKGLGRPLAARLGAVGARRIVHVACDPAALARDVAALGEAGYALEGLRVFDAFPMTHHVECVATLVLSGPVAVGDAR